MKFKSQVYTEASGSIGGITYSRNSAGMYTRGRVLPVNTNTARQQVIRNAMAAAQSAWLGLTTIVQGEWNAYAAATPIRDRLGAEIYVTGRAMYIRQYVLRAQASKAQIIAAPASAGIGVLNAVTAAIHGTSCTVTPVSGGSWRTASGFASVFCSLPKPVGRNFYAGPYQFLGVIGGTSGVKTLVLPTSYQAGQKGFIRVQALQGNGRFTNEQTTTAVAT